MTDIYPQSPDDSHALLAEEHPLMARVRDLEKQLANANLRAEVWQNHVEASARRNGKPANQELADSLHTENKSLRAENIELQHKLEACIKTIAVISERLILEDI